MACPTGRCALRRFDGHGTNSYRPTNPEAARQFNSDMERMMAERARQDGCWLQPAATAGNSAAASPAVAGKFPGAGLLRQMTPEPSSPRFAAAAKSSAGNSAAAAAEAADPKHCWALSS